MSTIHVAGSTQALCSLCDEMSGGMPAPFRSASGLTHRIIKATPSFVVLPSISPLVAGHVMIIPKDHSSGMLSAAATRKQFLSVLDLVFTAVSASYGLSCVFEHGIGIGMTGGCGIDHAHVHVLPLSLSRIAVVHEALARDFDRAPRISIDQAFENHDCTSSYLFFGSSPLDVVVHYSEEIPSQYIRHTIAAALNQPCRHWREMFGWDQFVDTFARLSRSLA